MPVAYDMQNEQLNVAMKDPEHLKRWLVASKRKYLVWNAVHLVDAMPWPEGVELTKQVVSAYRDHRRTIPTGWVEDITVEDRVTGVKSTHMDVPVHHGETLSLEETREAILQLQEHERWLVEDLRKRGARED